MAKLQIKTQFNIVKRKDDYEHPVMPSITVPDQTMSVNEIMRRYAQGLPVGGAKVPLYEPDNEFPDLNMLDLADKEAYIDRLKEEQTQLKEKLQRQRQQRVKAAETPKPSTQVADNPLP